jgi:hypothetical protein
VVLADSHTTGMFSHMKTTLNISDAVMMELRRDAASSGRTMSELVESAPRMLLAHRTDRKDLPELPTFDGGRALVDVSNRDALYDAMEPR